MSPRRLGRAVPLFVSFWLLALSCLLWAQLPTATLNGIVTDPKGAVVPGVKVVLTNEATGATREVSTGDEGRYVFPNLPPGDYDVRVEVSGFAAREFKDIHLEVGRSVTLDVELQLAAIGQTVTVTGGASEVELTQSQVQGRVTSSTMENIPLNGRNFLELAFLIPGSRPATNYDPTKTNTLEVSSAGAFGRGGNITVDGGDNNDEVVGGTLANFPQDGVHEFQIATNRFTAEVGRSGSSIINIITKSGTNDYHGSAFIFFRHKELQGLPATFTRVLPSGAKAAVPPFDREQFGGSVGGPIKHDKAFWFFSIEDRNQDHAVPVGVRDFTIRDVIGGSAPAFIDDVMLTSRADFKITKNNDLAVRYSFNRAQDVDNGSLRKPQGTAANRQQSLNRFHSVLTDWTRVISPTMLNSLIFHVDTFINEIPAFGQNNPVTNPAGLAAGNEIRFPILQDGANFRIPQRTRMNRYQLRDTFSWTRGTHALKLGAEWQNAGTDVVFDLFGSGSIFLTEDFPTQDRNQDGMTDDRDIPVGPFSLRSAAPTRPPSAPFLRDTYLGFYAQDDWRVRPNLTFNLGLRWEFDNNVLAEGDFSRPCPEPLTTTPTVPCKWIRNVLGPHDSPGYKNFGPRVGFAWDPFRKGKTVVRGGYGIYYDRVVLEVPVLEVLLDGRILPLELTAGSTLDVNGNFLPDPITDEVVNLVQPFAGDSTVFGIGINVIDNQARQPMVQQFTLGVQHEIRPNWVVSADGIHNFGQRLLIGRLLRSTTSTSPLISCPNGIDPCTVTDPLTGRSDNITNIESSAKTWYDGLLVSFQKRPTRHGSWSYGFNVNYTLSKTFNFANDDQIPFNGAEDQVNLVLGVNNLRLEKGYAPTDERHRFVFYGIFEMPWQISVSPIWTMSSSVPMDSFVPALNARLPILPRNALGRDIKTGAELNAAIGQWHSFLGITCPGDPRCLPNVNANLEFGDAFNSFDMRITKTFTFAERHKVQFISEVFNLFNITNIRGFNNTNFSGFNNDITSSSLNQPLRTAGGFFGSGGPRAFQFAVRYSF